MGPGPGPAHMQDLGLHGIQHQQAPPPQSLHRESQERLPALPSLELLQGFDESGHTPRSLPGEPQALRSSPGLLPCMPLGQQNQVEDREQQQLPMAHRGRSAAPHLATSPQPRDPASGDSTGQQSTSWRSSQPFTDFPPPQHRQQPPQPAPSEQQSAPDGQDGCGDYLSRAMLEVMGSDGLAGSFDFTPAALQQQVGALRTLPAAL